MLRTPIALTRKRLPAVLALAAVAGASAAESTPAAVKAKGKLLRR